MNQTLYLEADEDITSAIDKLNKAEGKEIRVVVPKRSTLLASMINLKLLKKAAGDAKKQLVLVTTDNTVISLASRVGLPVAQNLKAEAEVPKAVETPAMSQPEVIEESDPAPPALPGAEPQPAPMSVRPVPDQTAEPAKPKPKSSRIPNFNDLQKRVMFGIGLAVLAGALFGLNSFIKRADVTIFAKGSKLPADVSFKAITDGEADPEAGEVAAATLSQDEKLSGSFPASGKKDAGTKATGTITISNYCYNPPKIASGTTFTSSSGKEFVSTEAVSVPAAVPSGGSCPSPTTASVPVTASKNGDTYNLAPTTYSVGSLPSSGSYYVRGTGSQMTGGTSKIIEVVTEADVKAARTKLIQRQTEIKDSLAKKADSSQLAVAETFRPKVSSQSADPGIGEEGSSFDLELDISFTMLAFDRADLEEIIRAEVENKIGEDNQIYDSGLGDADITAAGGGEYDLSTQVYAGARLDIEQIKALIKGNKLGEAGGKISELPGVDRAEVNLSPFWVTRVPRFGSRINVDIKVETDG